MSAPQRDLAARTASSSSRSASSEFDEPQRRLPHWTRAGEDTYPLPAPQLIGIALDRLEIIAAATNDQSRVPVSSASVDEEHVAWLHLARVPDGDLMGDPSEAGAACLLPHVMHASGTRHRRCKPLARARRRQSTIR